MLIFFFPTLSGVYLRAGLSFGWAYFQTTDNFMVKFQEINHKMTLKLHEIIKKLPFKGFPMANNN